MLAGSNRSYDFTAHHNIHFGEQWKGVFDDLTHGRLMSDPSILVSRPTASDPSLAPAGKEIYYVLFPTPNMTAGIDWAESAPRYREHVISQLESRGYEGFGDAIEVEDVTTPLEWEQRGMQAGAPFASAHTFGQTGPFRPGNLWGENVVFTGSGTQPGVGVPMVLVSGRSPPSGSWARTRATARGRGAGSEPGWRVGRGQTGPLRRSKNAGRAARRGRRRPPRRRTGGPDQVAHAAATRRSPRWAG